MTTRVLVIGGGQNAEHEVSLSSAAGVAEALRSEGFEVRSATIDLGGVWHADGAALGGTVADSFAAALGVVAAVDVVFPAIHGAPGEDGSIAALCRLAGKKIVGSDLHAGAIGMDKWATKLVADAVGLRTARGRLVTADALDDVTFEGDVVVKPVSAGSSYGVSLARSADELREALRTAAQFDHRLLVEEVISAREIDVAVIREADGSRWVAPALEIHAAGLFDTETKYDGSARFTVPAELSDTDKAALEQAAATMFDALGCAGVARMDFFLTADGPILNEVNTMPGLTAHSQVPRMFQAVDISYPELMARLVRAAVVPGE